jgi:hypothetical protein
MSKKLKKIYDKKIHGNPGEKNPMFGKSVLDVWTEKYGEEEAKVRHESWLKNVKNANKKNMESLSDNDKKKFGHSGEKNNMFGKSVLDVWVQKYGEEEANKMWKERSEKLSKNAKGEKNPMFGKPSPNGSGNGWSGWYEGIYFRSLLELSYMYYLKKLNITFECIEQSIKIPYIGFNGQKRNYFPDYRISNYIVEIKPKHLWDSLSIKLKSDAAREWCKNNNYIYKIIEPKKLSFQKIEKLYLEKKIIFLDRYEEKFKQFTKKQE